MSCHAMPSANYPGKGINILRCLKITLGERRKVLCGPDTVRLDERGASFINNVSHYYEIGVMFCRMVDDSFLIKFSLVVISSLIHVNTVFGCASLSSQFSKRIRKSPVL